MNSLLFYLTSAFLLLALLWQGKHVRARTLRLPPPKGNRKETVKDDLNHFNLLVLGDSAAEGVGVKTQDKALLGQLVYKLKKRLSQPPLSYQLIARTGDTTADIINHLNEHIEHHNLLFHADLVVISAGVNDVTTLTKLRQWKDEIQILIDLLQKKVQAKHIIFTAVPPMQHFPALPFPLNTWLGLRASMLNRKLEKVCGHYDHVDFLELELNFDPKYMAADGFHPSETTYQAWAEACVSMHMDNRKHLDN